jgi:exodeoxyribonuclease-3
LRIDHLLLSRPLLVAAGVDREVQAREHSSNHALVWIELADANTGSWQRTRRPNKDSRS